MTWSAWVQMAVLVGVLTALTPVLGSYLTRVFRGERTFLTAVAGPTERLIVRAIGAGGREEQDWKQYAHSVLLFSALCLVALYVTLRTQGIHPFNPEGFHSGTWDLSFNTATSFVSNTSWQYYGGEATLSYFAQMFGIALHSFAGLAESANLEGKEQRFGVGGTTLYAVSTTAGASGAVNGAMESFSGEGAAVVLANIMTGELIFGGIGSGMSGMLLTVVLAVFLAGLMVGRTPEYLGK